MTSKLACAFAAAMVLSACVSSRPSGRPAADARDPSTAASPARSSDAIPTSEALLAWSQAVYAFEQAHYSEAAKSAGIAIAGGMDSIEARLLYAEALAYSGELVRAESVLSDVISKFPKAPPSAHFLLGKIYLIWGKTEKAEAAIGRAFTHGGQDDEALYQLGDLQLRQRSIPGAIQSFKTYVDRNPEDPEGLTRYAVALLDGGRADEAEAVLKRLLEVDPDNRLALFSLALLAEQREEQKKAAGLYDRLLDLDPGNIEVLLQRANLAEQWKEFDTAINLRTRAVRESPKNLQNRYQLGQLYIDAGRETDAYEVFKELARDLPELGQPYVQMGYIEIRRGRHAQAITLLRSAADRMPDNAEIPTMIGYTYLAMKADTLAVPAFERAIRLDSKNVEILFALGEVQYRLGDNRSAIRTFQKILNLKSDHAAALNFLGYIYAEKGIRLAEAERMVKKALKVEPMNAYYLDSLGWIYFKKGRIRLALEYLDRASRILSDAVIFEHLGDVHAALGSIPEARDSYRRSLEKTNSRTVEDKLRTLGVGVGP
ncbi:tetratricopeptide repeat protein [bacterium]|nr:tetratricopeptide repeat protein [bacterium]